MKDGEILNCEIYRGDFDFDSVGFGASCSAGVYQLTVTNKQKFFFIAFVSANHHGTCTTGI